MSDTIEPEDKVAVEDSPAPPHPRSDSAAVSRREPTGGSPFRDEIDELVDASLSRGPKAWSHFIDRCQHCGREWHGKQNDVLCQGSHIGGGFKKR